MSSTRKSSLVAHKVRAVMEEPSLQDTEVLFSPGGTRTRMNGILLSLVSPVLHKMVCGAFKEGVSKQLELGEMEERAFVTVVRLACGVASMEVRHVVEVVELAKAADRLQMSEVVEELSATVYRELRIDTCAEVLRATEASGLGEVNSRCRCFALDHFEEMARTASFVDLGEEVLGRLLDDDELVAGSEEAVLEAVVGWMKAGADGLRGEGLLRKVRYPLMGDEYLGGGARRLLWESELLGELVSEGAAVKSAARERRGQLEMGGLGSRALVARRGRGVAWGRYEGSRERWLSGHDGAVIVLAECMGRVCSGSRDGSIRIWSKSALAADLVLEVAGMEAVYCLTCWERHLISGDINGMLRMWDVASGRCKLALEGHQRAINSLVVCRGRLVSGSDDKSIKVWVAGEGISVQCERTLEGHTNWVTCLAVWEGKVVSGSRDNTVGVWDVEGGVREAILEGHTGSVNALVVAGMSLMSGSCDGMIRVWAVGTWELLQTVPLDNTCSVHFFHCMVVSGSKLVTGSTSKVNRAGEVRVWGLENLECERTLHQPGGSDVRCLLSMTGEVWAGVGSKVMVWGRE